MLFELTSNIANRFASSMARSDEDMIDASGKSKQSDNMMMRDEESPYLDNEGQRLDTERSKEKTKYEVKRPVSRYRREHLRYLRGQPKKIYIQIICKNEYGEDKSSVFELDLDTLTCKTDYIDAQKKFQVIFQTQSKNGVKHLLIRSPMLITNNLQIPLEVHLMKKRELKDMDVSLSKSMMQFGRGSGGLMMKPSNKVSIFDENGSDETRIIIVKPESSSIIPLSACAFNQVKIRPFLHNSKTVFDWSQTVDICLMKDDGEIFEREPVVMESQLSAGV